MGVSFGPPIGRILDEYTYPTPASANMVGVSALLVAF
jgi:hypothetical protein